MKRVCHYGEVELEIESQAQITRLRCLCNSCRGFDKLMGHDNRCEHGGIEICQTVPASVKITKGKNQLAAYAITEKGLMRWVCQTCKEPLANTLPRANIQFIGLPLPRSMHAPNAPELEHRGGMFMEVKGHKEQRTVSRA